MRKIYSLVLILTSIIFFAQKKNNDYSFYENKGQIVDQNGNANPDVKYLLNSPGLNVQIKKNGFSYDVYETEKKESKKEISNNDLKSDKRRDHSNTILKHKHHRVDIKFVDSKSNPEIVSELRSQDYENYYNLPYKKEGVSFVYRYKKLTYKNLYDNIDLVFFKPEDSTKPVEYNFLVHPGGRMSDIKMKFQGAKTKLKDGKLSMDLRFGEMQENIPNSWIENDRKQNITVNYKDFGNQTFGFESSINNSDKTIVIDPVPTRIWGSYLSGNQDIYGTVKTDIEDNVYVFGLTWSSTNIATAGAYQPTFNTTGFSDSFITKISKDGSTKLWGTYCGDKFYDEFMSVTFDPSSNVYATGMTWLPKTPTSNQYNVFKRFSLLKFNKNGTMIFSKILGGNVEEVPYDIDFKNNKLYLVGETRSTSGLATTGAFQETKIDGYTDGFIGRFDAITGDADWLTYFGGNSPTSLYQIFNSDSNYIEIMGASRASDLVMQNPIKGTNIQGKTTGLYLKFSDNGSLIYSTYLGDDSVDSDYFRYARRVGNNIFFSGRTTKSTSEQALLYKIDTNTNTLVSRKEFRIYNFQHTSYIDRQGNIFISGMVDNSSSWLSQIGTPDAFLPNPVSYAGVYAIKYDSDLNKIWGTFYWGSQLPDIIKDSEDNLYFFGMASGYSPYVGTPGAFQETASSVYNGMYIAKFKDCSSFAQLTSNSPVCVGKPIELSANGGANYDWTGPNGFTSKEQNPKIPDASLASAGTYTCSITGTLGCDTSTSITIVVGDNLKPVPNIATLPKIIGDCKTVITSIPLATDNCTGTITATTTDPLSYQLPGTYTITWKYDDGNGNITTQAQNVEITPQPLPIANPTQTFCKIEKRKISDISVTATNPKWYDENGILITNLSKELDDNTKYYVSQTAGGCESAKTEILIKLSDPNPPTGDAVQSFCSATMPKLSNVVVNGNAIKWYNNLGVFIPNPTSTDLEDGKTYFASQTLSGCESTVRLPVKVNVVTNYLSANNYSKSLCNDTTSSIKTENLDKYKKELILNPDDYTFLITDSKGEKIIGDAELLLNENIFDVKIISGLGCYQLVKLSLTLNEKPKIDLPAEKEFCDNIGTPLDAGFNKDYSYSWNTGETTHQINADKEQTYTVQVTTPFGCTNTASVIVKKAKLAEIENILINNDTAMMLMSFAGEYLYSMDQVTWQESNKFINLKNGNHTVFVKTKLGCDLGSKIFTIFSLSNIFTPNNDGVNDTWKISGIEYYPNSEVKIIDKNGITVVNHTTKGEAYEWNGESNGRKLPTDSYWYQIKLSDGRILQGYVVIKNRN